MRQSNGCSSSAPRSSAAKQWLEQLAQKTKKKHAIDRLSAVRDKAEMKSSTKKIEKPKSVYA